MHSNTFFNMRFLRTVIEKHGAFFLLQEIVYYMERKVPFHRIKTQMLRGSPHYVKIASLLCRSRQSQSWSCPGYVSLRADANRKTRQYTSNWCCSMVCPRGLQMTLLLKLLNAMSVQRFLAMVRRLLQSQALVHRRSFCFASNLAAHTVSFVRYLIN